MKILNAPLKVSYGGQKSTTLYRAILQTNENLPILAIEQEIKNKWYATGGYWHLGILTENNINDSIAIDGGLKWNVTQGMKGAINEAVALCDGLEAVQKAYKAVFEFSTVNTLEQSPSEYCKAQGLAGLMVVMKATGKSRQTLTKWYKQQPELFKIIVDGLVYRKISRASY